MDRNRKILISILAMLVLFVGFLLHLRIRAQFRGENLNESAARPKVTQTRPVQLGWHFPGFSQSVAAVFEKEMRYLGRSGPMLVACSSAFSADSSPSNAVVRCSARPLRKER